MGRKRKAHFPQARTQAPATDVQVTALGAMGPVRSGHWGGDKFHGGFGATELLTADYWTLRQRSSQLFRTNLYARGLIRRLVTGIIHTGLHLEATPEEAILGYPEDGLAEWAEDVENRFALWSNSPLLCDYRERSTWGQLQADAEREALVAGDVLVVLRTDQRTGLPRVQLVPGDLVRSPARDSRSGTKIEHGVELDAQGRQVAYWVTQDDGTSKRLPAWGERSGRRIAWLVYGSDRRLDQVRGEPLLSLVLQSLKEIDRYRDSTQRKAVINSMLAMFLEKTQDKPGSAPIGGGAVRRGSARVEQGTGDLTPRTFDAVDLMPGLIIEELQHGEVPKAFNANGSTEGFGVFEEAVVQAVAWSMEIPPEILKLAFSSNYSASQAANNEFKMVLNVRRTDRGTSLCSPVYVEWLISEAMSGRIQAPDLLSAWRDPLKYDVFAAWTSCDWSGNIKPAVDLLKLAKSYEALIAIGAITRDRAARELTGTKFSKNVQKLARENEQLAEANKPMAPPAPVMAEPAPADEDADDVEDVDTAPKKGARAA